MTSPQLARATLGHSLTRMTGRTPDEPHRTATPLELLFDLAFVVAFGAATNWPTPRRGPRGIGIVGFVFAMFAICWAWINFSWFASAYDTDDWFYRLTTMVQMVGVLVLALGLPPCSPRSTTATLDNGVMVAGYVIMRIAMVAQWLRAAKQDPPAGRLPRLRRLHRWSQLGWVALIVLTSRRRPSSLWPLLYLSSRRPGDRRSAAGRSTRGTRTTSPSATGCSRSSRSAKA